MLTREYAGLSIVQKSLSWIFEITCHGTMAALSVVYPNFGI